MNISSLYTTLGIAQSTTGVGSTPTTSSPTSNIAAPAAGSGSSGISSIGQFFSQLQQLSQQNPTEFKAVASQLATTFQNAASGSTGQDAKALTALAAQFTQAAQTGSLQQPQSSQEAQRSGGHHHHHGGGSSASPSGAIQQAFQSAESILAQATQGTTSPSSPTPST